MTNAAAAMRALGDDTRRQIFDELANTLGVVSGLGIGWAGVAYLKARTLVDGTGEGLASKQN